MSFIHSGEALSLNFSCYLQPFFLSCLFNAQHEPLVFCSLFCIYHSFHTNLYRTNLCPDPDLPASNALTHSLSNTLGKQFVDVLNFRIFFLSQIITCLFLIDPNFPTRFSAMSTIVLNEPTTIAGSKQQAGGFLKAVTHWSMADQQPLQDLDSPLICPYLSGIVSELSPGSWVISKHLHPC